MKCPADRFTSAAQKKKGWTERVRSVSGNIGIGDGNAETGPWDMIYKHIKKTGDFVFPGPTETWVYLDEHPDSINDAGFLIRTSAVGLINRPPTTTARLDLPLPMATPKSKWKGSLSTARSSETTKSPIRATVAY